MLLPKSGAWIEFERHAAHRRFPRFTIHIGLIWQSHSDRLAGKPGVRWDATLGWDGPHADPAGRILAHFDGIAPAAFIPPPAGESHFCAAVVSDLSDGPDTHGNLARPSMQALQAVAT